MSRGAWTAAAVLLTTSPAAADELDETEQTEQAEAQLSAAQGIAAFTTVYGVLQHPRCLNCHPDGDKPLQYDTSTPHTMEVDRLSMATGLPCSTCHRAEGIDGVGIPPAGESWVLAPPDQVFQGRSEAALCAQLRDPATNGDRDLDALLHHVSHDALVLYGWDPGGGRTTPAVSHADFVAAFQTWVSAGGPCPSD